MREIKMGTSIYIANGNWKYYEFRRYANVVDEFKELINNEDVAYQYLKSNGQLSGNNP